MQVKTLYTLKIQPDILTIYKDGKLQQASPFRTHQLIQQMNDTTKKFHAVSKYQ